MDNIIKKNQIDDFIYQVIILIWEIIKKYRSVDFSLEITKVIKERYNCNEDLASSLFRPIYWYLYINTCIVKYDYKIKEWIIDLNYKDLDNVKMNELIEGIKKKYESTMYHRIKQIKTDKIGSK
jgi:hypothetical protein